MKHCGIGTVCLYITSVVSTSTFIVRPYIPLAVFVLRIIAGIVMLCATPLLGEQEWMGLHTHSILTPATTFCGVCFSKQSRNNGRASRVDLWGICGHFLRCTIEGNWNIHLTFASYLFCERYTFWIDFDTNVTA